MQCNYKNKIWKEDTKKQMEQMKKMKENIRTRSTGGPDINGS